MISPSDLFVSNYFSANVLIEIFRPSYFASCIVTFLLSTKHVDEVQQEFTSDMALSVSARHDTARFNMTHHDKFCHVEQNRI